MSRPSLVLALLLALLLPQGCTKEQQTRSRGRSPVPEGPPKRWHYELSLDPALTLARVKLCFEGPVADELRPGTDAAAVYLRSAEWLSPGPRRKLPVRDGKVQIPVRAAGGCLRYEVDLERAVGQSFRLASRFGEDLLANPALWLWRPERRSPSSRASLTLRLPAGVRASLPWPIHEGRAQLTAADFRFRSYAAFGRFEPLQLTESGVRLGVSVLGAPLSPSREEIADWLRTVVAAVAQVPGQFPVPTAQVLLVNLGSGGDPVAFGTVGRGGNASVLLLVSGSATAEELRRDWVLPHEFSHLYLPFVEREQAWLPEGLATYYQEVLRARAGLKSPREAWETIVRSSRSAARQGTGRTLAAESAAMHRTYAYRRVYWAGAAYALISDARLRAESQGGRSLDSAIRDARWWRDPEHVWSAADVIAALDAAAQTRVFSETAAVCLESEEFPPLRDVLDKLGVQEVGGGRVRLDDAAPWAAVRRAIMQPGGVPAAPP